MTVTRFAGAKVNLALHVLRRRPDSYHDLDTLAVFADTGDQVSADAAEDLTLAISGPRSPDAPAGPDNLVLRAARALREAAGVRRGAALRLCKALPSGAGFGGGSADAAATLHALNALWRLDLSAEALMRLARGIGADVPMCFAGHALRARGVGEAVEEVPGWPALPLALVWPARPVSTAAVFAALAPDSRTPLTSPPQGGSPAAIADWLVLQRNDLEAPARRLAPEIGAALDALRASAGCLLARMSGSGSGCFGLFGNSEAAERAAAAIAAGHPDWWTAAALAR